MILKNVEVCFEKNCIICHLTEDWPAPQAVTCPCGRKTHIENGADPFKLETNGWGLVDDELQCPWCMNNVGQFYESIYETLLELGKKCEPKIKRRR